MEGDLAPMRGIGVGLDGKTGFGVGLSRQDAHAIRKKTALRRAAYVMVVKSADIGDVLPENSKRI
jgi:hypothetical protein